MTELIERIRTGSHTIKVKHPMGKRSHTQIVEEFETVYHNNLTGKEWLKDAHAKRWTPLSEYRLEIHCGSAKLIVNGDTKSSVIKDFMRKQKKEAH